MSARLADEAERARSEVSGVNLDEEAARLLQFQQAYQASAKVISTASDMFKTLLAAIS
jgi:flagellar hook-associated protein 1 FlgK